MVTDPIIEINEIPLNTTYHQYLRHSGFSRHDDALPVEDDDRRYAIAISEAFPKGDEYYQHLFSWAEKEKMVTRSYRLPISSRDIGNFKRQDRAPTDNSKDEMRTTSGRTTTPSGCTYTNQLPPFHGHYRLRAGLGGHSA